MIRVASVALAFVVLSPSAARAGDAAKDLEKMQGDWTLSRLTIDGRDMPADSRDVAKIVIEGNKLTAVLRGPDGKEERKSMMLMLLPDKGPNAVDFVPIDGPAGAKTAPGIYELDGDTLRFCAADFPKSKDRPTVFDAKAGTGQALWELKRIKK